MSKKSWSERQDSNLRPLPPQSRYIYKVERLQSRALANAPVLFRIGSPQSVAKLWRRWAIEAPEQNRLRRFSFGTLDGRALTPVLGLIENPHWERTVVATSSKEGALAKSQGELRTGISKRLGRNAGALPGQNARRTIERCAELQGLPRDFLADAPFTAAGKYLAIGNGVPLPMGRAIAKAVKVAISDPLESAA